MATGSSALVLDHVALRFHRKNSHGFSMQVCSGRKVVIGLEIVASVAIHN